MNYIYIPGFSNYPVADIDNLLNAYEHIGEEMHVPQALTFIGRIYGFLHRLELKPFNTIANQAEKTVYYPQITKLKIGEAVDVATNKGILLMAG